MKVTGCSFVRNAIRYDYPIVEAITSILPICDEFIVAVGDSDDETLSLIQAINSPKIRVIETVWNPDLKKGGEVLADETNKALKAISADTDWIFYIQGDEVVHENYLPEIQKAMVRWKDDSRVEGLLFHYLHFYGSYDYVGNSPRWYYNEIRIVKNLPEVYSYRDAQGFRIRDNQKLKVKQINAYVYHYGWVKEPYTMQRKSNHISTYYLGEENKEEKAFDYSGIDSLARFEGTHPAVMKSRIARKNWTFEHDLSYSKISFRYRLKRWLQKKTGWAWGEYRNYDLLK
ncbi:MAG: glycosyltransferase family 2 protein [Siphonobacter sp.]